uniref:Uncharacterized protein n=1 Tax=Lepeophtheirus salmonis TaxID=72036 RepID=A0A0K2UTY2_LEPSM
MQEFRFPLRYDPGCVRRRFGWLWSDKPLRGLGQVVKGRVVGECEENCKAQYSWSNLKLQ